MSFMLQSLILDVFSLIYFHFSIYFHLTNIFSSLLYIFMSLYILPDKVGQPDICLWSAHPLQRLLQHDWPAHQWSVEQFFILRLLKTSHILPGWVFKAIKHLYIIMLFTFETYKKFLRRIFEAINHLHIKTLYLRIKT